MSVKETFTVYPAIDIRGGKCVRLFKGDYNQETVYGEPLEMAQKWEVQGASWLHLVDLDGAKAGHPVNDQVISEVAKAVDIPVQVGGGIRSLAHVEQYLQCGVERVILGTSAIKDPDFVKAALQQYGKHIAIGLDARDGFVAVEGWLQSSEVRVEELALRLVDQGAETFIFTDISKDGTLSGPNTEATADLAQRVGKPVIASGGVSQLEDIRHLAQYVGKGISGAIVGKALYQPVFSLTDAQQVVEEV
ncbi:1-(5-phosphoribosyl)-5-[(5-phosphoribosylamino)methylideneamino]imidazole-4-carboxamide isomerase [Caldalkalibacillus salinus]|uniref:1-(5-phosphoribosyl)-5-[(5- phosphoribosylamino)methylideneamino]imidazole-4- carboxamide isomerase n=1 Tax=Caldalkalibacillus salinus TaxID=2803787 RepID=UPI0019222437